MNRAFLSLTISLLTIATIDAESATSGKDFDPENGSYERFGGAYYFRYPSGERWEKFAKVGDYADAMIQLEPGDDRLVFWRGASYRPFLDTTNGREFVDVAIPQNGDGPGLRFDRINRHSHIRILEDTPARVVVQWRYLPNFDRPDPPWWAEEYFTVYPNGVCYRSVHPGAATLEEYIDPDHAVVERFLLTSEGIRPLPASSRQPAKLEFDNETLVEYQDLGFNRQQGNYALAVRQPGDRSRVLFKPQAELNYAALTIRGWGDARARVTVDGKPWRGLQSGFVRRMDNDDLVLWLGGRIDAGSQVCVDPVGGSPRIVRAPIRDPYKLRTPRLPKGSADPGPFGAYYTTLKYWDEWDRPWRVGDYADVVVQFDRSPDRLVFWRGTTYVPHWVNESNHWYNNEFCERRGRDSGLDGLCEPMQDHDCNFSQVKIVHNTPARVVVHWRYHPVTLQGEIPFTDKTGWGDTVDEYHYVYPDATAVRDTTLFTSRPDVFHEWHEAIPVTGPGEYPEDVLDMKALSVASMDGKVIEYDFRDGFPPNDAFRDGYNIVLVGLKGTGKPFAIAEPFGQWWDPISRPDGRFNQYDDWPAWPKKYRRGDWKEDPTTQYKNYSDFLPSHSSLMHLSWDNFESDLDGPIIYLRRILLHGMTSDANVGSLVPLANYWQHAPPVEVSGYGFSNAVFDKVEKAYKLQRRVMWLDHLVNQDDDKTPNGKAVKVDLKVLASAEAPVINPCFVIHGWPRDARARLLIDGVRIPAGSRFRQGVESVWGKWEPQHSLVVWVQSESRKPTTYTIELAE